METSRAQELLRQKRQDVEAALSATHTAAGEDREAEDERDAEMYDPAQPLAQEGVDDEIADSLRDQLAAIDRAEERLAAGTYGRSVQSGDPIPDERLEAQPTAELTIAEQELSDRDRP